MNTPTGIENLEQARQHVAGTRCAGCGKEGTRSAHEVHKEGPNQGRLFAKCRHCGSFDWLTAAGASDEALDRTQATAGACPKCGKPRRVGRVAKDGSNKGRLFLTCADPACDSFAWVSPSVGDSPAPGPRPASGPPRDEGSFLTIIRENPDDDTHRLVFADWLEENDQAARAELIRVQIECHSLGDADPARVELDRRAREILAELEDQWAAPLRPFAQRWAFVRGLIDEVEIEVRRFVENVDAVLRAAPVAGFRVRVENWDDARALTTCRRLREVRRLTLVGGRLGGAGARILAESPHVAGLKALALPDQSLGQPGVQALVGSRYLSALESLDLSGNNLARSAIPILLSSPHAPRLRRLVLAYNLLQDSDARALANSSRLPELLELDLSGNNITREGINAVLDSPLGKRLRKFKR